MTWLRPLKQKTSKQEMPSKAIAQDPVAAILQQLDEWLQARTITVQEHAALRAQALGLAPPNALHQHRLCRRLLKTQRQKLSGRLR